jgi:chromosome segregation ATPase
VSTVTYRREKTYTVKLRGGRDRDVLIEHPSSADWILVDPKQAEERTRDLYRFQVRVPAGGTRELVVAEERRAEQTVAVTNASDDLIAVYLRSTSVSQRVKDALAEIARRKAELADTVRQRQEQERRAQSIRGEQGRIRQNMDSLDMESPLYKRYVSQLDAQETELEGIAAEVERLAAREGTLRKGLDDYILSLDVS